MNTHCMRRRRASGAQRHGPRRAGAAGYTLVAVLLAVAVMAGLVATYGRHVVVAGRAGMTSPALLESREACHSGLAYARQALVSGNGNVAASIPIGDTLANVSVTTSAGGHQVLSVESVGGDGLGARRKAELGLKPMPVTSPSAPAFLPTLGPAAVADLLDNGSLTVQHITTSTRIEGAVLSGLLVLHAGVELELDDVVLTGAVVSASVLALAEPIAFNAATAPRLIVDGNLRIDPLPALPGLAILLPDGAVSSGEVDARIQIKGDVVAHDVSLLHAGALSGNVIGVDVELADASLLDRVGHGRKPSDWSSSLNLGGANEPVFLAAVPASATLGSLSAITGFWSQAGAGP